MVKQTIQLEKGHITAGNISPMSIHKWWINTREDVCHHQEQQKIQRRTVTSYHDTFIKRAEIKVATSHTGDNAEKMDFSGLVVGTPMIQLP